MTYILLKGAANSMISAVTSYKFKEYQLGYILLGKLGSGSRYICSFNDL